MSAQEKLIDAINDVNLSQWDEVQAYMERQIADAILSSDWLAAHDAEKRAEWEAEQEDITEWWKAVANSADDLLRDVKNALNIRPSQDPVIEARRIAAALAEQGETEWEVEHGLLVKIGGNWAETEWEPEQFDEAIAGYPHNEYVRAERKVTPWLPVPDTTNNESEGKA